MTLERTCAHDESVAKTTEFFNPGGFAAENQQFRKADSAGLVEIASAVRHAVQTAMANANLRTNERQSLVDVKGVGKPPMFKGASARFTERLRKTTGFLIAAWGSAFRPVIEWLEDQDNVITNDALEQQFGLLSGETVDDVLEKSEQVHVALSALTASESIDVVLGAAPSFLEEQRRLVRRWDPLGGGKCRARLRQILGPDRCKLQNLLAGLEQWEELVRRYERCTSSGTTRAALNSRRETGPNEPGHFSIESPNFFFPLHSAGRRPSPRWQ